MWKSLSTRWIRSVIISVITQHGIIVGMQFVFLAMYRIKFTQQFWCLCFSHMLDNVFLVNVLQYTFVQPANATEQGF
jgi:hypothetical protein